MEEEQQRCTPTAVLLPLYSYYCYYYCTPTTVLIPLYPYYCSYKVEMDKQQQSSHYPLYTHHLTRWRWRSSSSTC
jgi:hypothetical protein